ncbi:alpha-L-rhamnosidase [Pedobacter sp. AK017]|uniref:glycoside hydrolase family 78 protein n=1 Tax=Pedobacter sp. AK017 TaxID=2723073 RepID=UPI00161E375A|nr:glycoside hydrolase family 78 protein [Pedobacter sp. AK017]MBB5438155.1 alpha-L-rhamnosidase [Pedobacter sp. AK017]
MTLKIIIKHLVLGGLLLFPVWTKAIPPCKVINMRCEYLTNPLGVDIAQPRLSWQLSDVRRDARQTAYQIYVGTDAAEVANGNGNAWISPKTFSATNLVKYDGKVLEPFTRYYWRVQIWDKENKSIMAGTLGEFETGMRSGTNWKGSWISDNQDVELKPAPYFRKTFSTDKKIKSARAFIAAAGLYELSINGQKVGNHSLDPVYTRFDRRVVYVTHDVTSYLNDNENAIGVLLGNGWYNHQSTAVWYFDKAPWRNRPAFCMDLRITYNDGSVSTISTDRNWKTSLSPVIFNSIYTAEHYDARLEQTGWDSPGFNDTKWKNAIYRSAPAPKIVSQMLHPIRQTKKLPASMRKVNDSTYVFNIGQNISGVSQLTVSGKRGTVIRIKHGERLNKEGLVDLSNIDYHFRPTDDKDPFQTDIFILSGIGKESFMPRFNYKGFQYVEITSSKPIRLNDQSLTAYFMHSDVPANGQIQSSNPTIDKIWKATNQSYLSNLFGYPTDCPQREKNGWTGDAHIAIETGLYNFDGITIYEKWMADHRDEQQPNGILPAIIPTAGWGYEWANGPDWTSTIAIIPWNIYLFYGDTTILADNYQNIKLYVDHLDEISPTGLTGWGLGDWVPVKSKSSVELTSSIYFFVDADILARTAKLLNRTADFDKYSALAGKIKNAINNKYLDRKTFIYGSGTQTELSTALYWGLVPEEFIPQVAANLAKKVQADRVQLDVGLLGTKTILNALSENGYADLAYQLAARETYPSWGWWIKNGATTLYENWNIEAKRDISLNHIMFGEIGAWLYKGLGGIRPDPQVPGFKHIRIAPHFVTGLDHFSASYNSPYGTITSGWKRSGKKISYRLTIPPGTTATVNLPNSKNQQWYMDGKRVSSLKTSVETGSYLFESN